jgi:site-specific DNA recombinase
VLLTEELARHGVETVFLKAPQTATPEDQLMVQFQGMIAEYERAQILERSRRGKRHRAQQGQVSVLSGAPYGYRYVRKTDDSAAYYEVIEAEAAVVRMVYERYSTGGMSIGAITRLLNDRGVPTRKQTSRWERSVTWAMLRNPAYKGTAYFGKTKIAQRQRTTRPLRLRGGIAQRNSANHERPQSEWIEIAVPAIVSEETFALAQELLQSNKERSPRRTIAPSLVQGLVSCKKCGYALSRTSTRSSARMIHYYRCIGSDAWRHLGSSVCDNRPVRQDVLDEVVWTEVIRLLEDPTLIKDELERRLDAAKDAAPSKRREETLNRELVRIQKSIERLTTAYQEDLLSLDELRQRLPALRQREGANRAELQSITDQIATRAAYLRLAQTLTAFLDRLRESADTLNVAERQRIVRLVVKEVLVVDDTIVIRHSIPVPGGAPDGAERTPPNAGGQRITPAASAQAATAGARLQPATPAHAQAGSSESYLLRSRRHNTALRRAFGAFHQRSVRSL